VRDDAMGGAAREMRFLRRAMKVCIIPV
jgi:hypothetical protein